MTMASDIKDKARDTFRSQWTVREGRVVPDNTTVRHNNDAVHFESATILYADLDSSTDLVDSKKWSFAGEVYKTFLYAASRVIRNEGGTITSYDGDRVMAVFLGEDQSSRAARSALKINYAIIKIVQPELMSYYTKSDYRIKHVVGIDRTEVHAVNAGVRGDTDLTWVGTAANYAAKLCAFSAAYPTWITKRVYDNLDESTKFGGTPRRNMWEERLWTDKGNAKIYRSDWHWSI